MRLLRKEGAHVEGLPRALVNSRRFFSTWIHVECTFRRRHSIRNVEEWVKQQAEDFLKDAESEGLEIKTLMHDRDTKFTKSIDAVLESASVEIKQSAFRSPNTNAFVERFIQTLQAVTWRIRVFERGSIETTRGVLSPVNS